MIAAEEALERLRAGNRRFVEGTSAREVWNEPARRGELLAGQRPFAVVFGCSDSRAPAELIFDQGLGDLFVIRVAGNIVAPSLIGSVEFAAEYFGTRLVVVLGHSQCGAVQATLAASERSDGGSSSRGSNAGGASPHIDSIVDRIRPALADLLAHRKEEDEHSLLCKAVRANIRASVEALHRESPLLKRHREVQGLRIVGAEYSLETGEVEFLER